MGGVVISSTPGCCFGGSVVIWHGRAIKCVCCQAPTWWLDWMWLPDAGITRWACPFVTPSCPSKTLQFLLESWGFCVRW